MLLIGAQCDRCGARTMWGDHTAKKYLVSLLRKKGWSVGRGGVHDHEEYTLCPDCKARGRRKNGEEETK